MDTSNVPATPTLPVDTAALGGSMPGAADLSVFSLFLQADTIVKIVMLLLVAASFWTWAIIFEKWLRLPHLVGVMETVAEWLRYNRPISP